MYYYLKTNLGLFAISIIFFSCTVSRNNSSAEDDLARQAVFNNYHGGNLSIGDTLTFHPEFIRNNTFILEDGKNGRNVTHRNHSRLASITRSGSGRIYVNVCINKAGEPVFVSIDYKETTIESRRTLENALLMISDYSFESDDDAPLYQCGLIKLFLDINAFR